MLRFAWRTGDNRAVQDLPDVFPLLVYRDIESAHELLVRAFGFAPGLLEREQQWCTSPRTWRFSDVLRMDVQDWHDHV